MEMGEPANYLMGDIDERAKQTSESLQPIIKMSGIQLKISRQLKKKKA